MPVIEEVTEEMVWPYRVALVARIAGVVRDDDDADDYAARYRRAVVATLLADEGRIASPWDEGILWLAGLTPGLLGDLREGRRMADELDANTLADFLASSTAFPGARVRAVRAMAAVRPELGDVVRRRAAQLGHPDPLAFEDLDLDLDPDAIERTTT